MESVFIINTFNHNINSNYKVTIKDVKLVRIKKIEEIINKKNFINKVLIKNVIKNQIVNINDFN